jgi:hypothetical protein
MKRSKPLTAASLPGTATSDPMVGRASLPTLMRKKADDIGLALAGGLAAILCVRRDGYGRYS